MITNAGIAQKEGTGHAMPVLSIQFIKDNCPTIGHLKKRVDELNRFVANNGRCTLVSPIDKNTTLQPQTFYSIAIKSEDTIK